MFRSGFTLVELLLVMGIIAILATAVLVAINPARQFAQARNTQRIAHVNTILNAIGQRNADNRGVYEQGCAAGPIPTSVTNIGADTESYNMYPCIVPMYATVMPIDPRYGSFDSVTDYDTGYAVSTDSTTGRVTVTATHAELDQIITATR